MVAAIDNPKSECLKDAAPDLLAALEGLMPLWEREDVADEWTPEFEAAQAAIAKAKGDGG